MPSNKKPQIGIAGGGIAGLYCAWKLAEANHDVTLFECLDRVGGRIETIDESLEGCEGFKGFKAECGPMRFELEIQDCFSELARELGIFEEFKKFTPPKGAPPTAEFPKYDLEPSEMSKTQKEAIKASPEKDAAMFSHLTSTLDLLKYGIYRIFQPHAHDLPLPKVVDPPEGAAEGTLSPIELFADSLEDKHLNRKAYDKYRKHFRIKKSVSGKANRPRLYTLGFWNALSTVLSPGAVAKVRDTGTFYHLLPENPSASEWSIFWLRLFKSEEYSRLFQIKGGVRIVVERLGEKLEALKTRTLEKGSYTLCKNAVVKAIQAGTGENAKKMYLQIAGDGELKEFDHVILALPAVPLREILAAFPEAIARGIRNVIPFPLLKVFVVIKRFDPWWSEKELPQPHQGAHIVPTREIHYFWPENGTRDRVMIMFYTDRPATSYWQTYIDKSHRKAQINNPPRLKHELAKQITMLLPPETEDKTSYLERVEKSIIAFAIRDWAWPPFGAGCHAWKPGVAVPIALDRLKAFSLKTVQSDIKNVHICGEAYSDYQGFIEGALRSAKDVMQTIVRNQGS